MCFWKLAVQKFVGLSIPNKINPVIDIPMSNILQYLNSHSHKLGGPFFTRHDES